VRSSVVVVLEETGEGGAALLVGDVDAAVGPALDQGLDEALRLPIGARPIRLGAQMAQPEPPTNDVVGVRAVAGTVVRA
jgi:hypothetical protein